DPLFTRQALYQLSYSGATDCGPAPNCNGAIMGGVLGAWTNFMRNRISWRRPTRLAPAARI
ncbi:MAG: hypothetical protein JWO23_2585, partial [Solirubrobacterales bacterium]|nr:hypothetical protein [Solirubrobacterales bacterium]